MHGDRQRAQRGFVHLPCLQGARRHGHNDRRRSLVRTINCTRCRKPLSPTARPSAASARPASSCRPRPCSTANADPSDDDIKHCLKDTYCRCTGYASILSAVKAAAEKMRTGMLPLPDLPDTDRTARHRSASRCPARTRSPRSPAAPAMPTTSSSPVCSMAPPCAARTLTPVSSPSTRRPRGRCPACMPCSPIRMCRATPATASSKLTGPSLPAAPTRPATWATPSRWSWPIRTSSRTTRWR